MSITLTERAAAHVKGSLEKRGKGVGIRLGVKTAGCSGLAYKIEFVDEAEGSDHAYDNYGVRVFVDAKSLVYLKGTTLDFVKEGLNEGLKFNNPNVSAECGCGESFTV